MVNTYSAILQEIHIDIIIFINSNSSILQEINIHNIMFIIIPIIKIIFINIIFFINVNSANLQGIQINIIHFIIIIYLIIKYSTLFNHQVYEVKYLQFLFYHIYDSFIHFQIEYNF